MLLIRPLRQAAGLRVLDPVTPAFAASESRATLGQEDHPVLCAIRHDQRRPAAGAAGTPLEQFL